MSITTESPRLDHPVGDGVVRRRAVGPGADDDEVGRGVPLVGDRLGDQPGRLPLGAPDLEELAHPVVHPVDRGAGLAQRGDLVDALAQPQVGDELAGGAEPCVCGSACCSRNTRVAHMWSSTATLSASLQLALARSRTRRRSRRG